MHYPRKLMALAAVSALALAACSSSSSDDNADAGANATSKEPVKLVLVAERQGDGPAGINDYDNGVQMAVAEINAAGGVDGRKIELTRLKGSGLDPQKNTADYLKALDMKPAAILGFQNESLTEAAASNIARGGVPTISITSAGDNTRFGGPAGSEFLWTMEYGGSVIGTQIDYLVEELKLSKIGIMAIDLAYGSASTAFAEKALAEHDLKPVTVTKTGPTATDMTKEVLEVKNAGADGVMSPTYPNQLAVQLKQFSQNGVDIPTITGGSGPIVVNAKMATGDALKGFNFAVPCNPQGATEGNLKAFFDNYRERYPDEGPPTYLAAYSYDSVYIVKAAIEKAGSSDPADVNAAIGEITVTPDNGVACSERYNADGSHFLNHFIDVISVGTDGSFSTAKSYETPEVPKA